MIGYVTISVEGCVFRAVKGVAYGPVYGLVHSFVIVHVSRLGSWTGYLRSERRGERTGG